MRKIVFPQESNLQPLDYRSTALPLEQEKTPPRMLNFGYLNPATCLLYDCNNKSMKMFFEVCRPEFYYFNRFACFWPKGYQLGSLGKSHQNGEKKKINKVLRRKKNKNKKKINKVLPIVCSKYYVNTRKVCFPIRRFVSMF